MQVRSKTTHLAGYMGGEGAEKRDARSSLYTRMQVRSKTTHLAGYMGGEGAEKRDARVRTDADPREPGG
jgi:hypothetical protein